MIIEVTDPGYNLNHIGVAAVVFIGLGVLWVAMVVFSDERSALWKFAMVPFLGMFIVPVVIIGAGFLSWDLEYAKATEKAIEGAGFDNVDVVGEKFLASRDSAYYEGALIDLGDDRFQIVEIKR